MPTLLQLNLLQFDNHKCQASNYNPINHVRKTVTGVCISLKDFILQLGFLVLRHMKWDAQIEENNYLNWTCMYSYHNIANPYW